MSAFRHIRTAMIMTLSMIVILGGAATSLAQGFMVEPMRIHVSVAPGQNIQVPVNIRNTATDGPRDLELRLAHLDQNTAGGWAFQDVVDGIPAHQSSLDWTSLSETDARIAPLEPAQVMLSIQPPRNARGAYFAALLIETPAPPEDALGLSVRMRFLIPVIIEIEGRPVRQNVHLGDVVMTYDEADDRAPTTRAHLRITNAGETFSRVTGDLRIERRSGDRWRLVTRFETRERPIIPGVTLELGQDLERRLPSGEYRLRGELMVDGRRLPPLTKEIEFEGDPNVDALAYDTELRLSPEMVQMDVVPGATRTTVLRIENPGEHSVTVDLGAATPRGLIGVRMGDLIGIDLSAEGWTTVRPAQFTLRGGANQNVRVISAVPPVDGLHANYYADLTLSGRYADGQSAGTQSSIIHLVNHAAENARQGEIESLNLAEVGRNLFAVQARFLNTGNTHVTPLARVTVSSPQGQTVRSVTLSGAGGMLLPLGHRVFGGEIDFSGVEPGMYGLRAHIDLEGGDNVTLQHVIEVQHEDVQTEDGTVQEARVTVREGEELPDPEDVEG
ncbi:hypothetical protein [Roseinatronobacter bogoriensis]|uniref:Uncharacterized protein n=1 Tax=Roseinatronobacter bogoriensis subsp. barguzinensis TaxID=441209 RepID=A0A2K8K9G8_9RHOB|nr:hypothetical protein [Rhodobaca]ATX65576.1 hypothetical protein BG454_06845 [Rhodobaca barguzinensis]MBB4208503.1 hypothetical protein [Rhodobaca bogoriensis DSM 18756]